MKTETRTPKSQAYVCMVCALRFRAARHDPQDGVDVICPRCRTPLVMPAARRSAAASPLPWMKCG